MVNKYKICKENIIDSTDDIVDNKNFFKKLKNKIGVTLLVSIGVIVIISSALLYFDKNKIDEELEHRIMTAEHMVTDDFHLINKPVTPTIIPTPTIAPTPSPTPLPTPSPTVAPTPTITFDLESRVASLVETSLGSKKERFLEAFTEEKKELFFKYGNLYGIDPYLVAALCMQESDLKTTARNETAIGIGQIKSLFIGYTVKAYNYETGQYDLEEITDEKRTDLESSIKIVTMLIQERINRYKNIQLSLQAYHFGESVSDVIVGKYYEERGLEKSLLEINYYDIKLIIDDAHDNPSKYMDEWHEPTYGDKHYLKRVQDYVIGRYTYYNCDGFKIILDLETGNIVDKINLNEIKDEIKKTIK